MLRFPDVRTMPYSRLISDISKKITSKDGMELKFIEYMEKEFASHDLDKEGLSMVINAVAEDLAKISLDRYDKAHITTFYNRIDIIDGIFANYKKELASKNGVKYDEYDAARDEKIAKKFNELTGHSLTQSPPSSSGMLNPTSTTPQAAFREAHGGDDAELPPFVLPGEEPPAPSRPRGSSVDDDPYKGQYK